MNPNLPCGKFNNRKEGLCGEVFNQTMCRGQSGSPPHPVNAHAPSISYNVASANNHDYTAVPRIRNTGGRDIGDHADIDF